MIVKRKVFSDLDINKSILAQLNQKGHKDMVPDCRYYVLGETYCSLSPLGHKSRILL